MNPLLFLYVGIGGGIGAILRYAVASAIGRWVQSDVNYAILSINILGSVLMGVLVGYGAHRGPLTLEMRTFLAVGVLGGFTTFSSFSLDVVSMMQKGLNWQAMIYLVASVVFSVLGLSIGLSLMRTSGG